MFVIGLISIGALIAIVAVVILIYRNTRTYQLRQIWSAVREDFDRALKLLPEPPKEDEGSRARFTDWLDHNELELALDELELLGNDNAMPREYWEILAIAAGPMGLDKNRCQEPNS